MNSYITSREDFNLKVTDKFTPIPCAKFTSATVQITNPDSETWASAVVTLKGSLDGMTPVTFPTSVTFSAVGLKTADIVDYAYLHIEVTTVESASGEVSVYVFLNDGVIIE